MSNHICRMFDISTLHLAPADKAKLNAGSYPGVKFWPFDSGWFVVATPLDGCSKELAKVMKAAAKEGCLYIKFDHDAPTHARLPVFPPVEGVTRIGPSTNLDAQVEWSGELINWSGETGPPENRRRELEFQSGVGWGGVSIVSKDEAEIHVELDDAGLHLLVYVPGGEEPVLNAFVKPSGLVTR